MPSNFLIELWNLKSNCILILKQPSFRLKKIQSYDNFKILQKITQEITSSAVAISCTRLFWFIKISSIYFETNKVLSGWQLSIIISDPIIVENVNRKTWPSWKCMESMCWAVLCHHRPKRKYSWRRRGTLISYEVCKIFKKKYSVPRIFLVPNHLQNPLIEREKVPTSKIVRLNCINYD